MFKEMGQIMGLMKNAGKIQEAFQKFQEELGKLVAEGDAGAGMVKVKVNGHHQVVRVEISDDAMSNPDKELLEELIRSATNTAIEKVQNLANAERGKLAESLGMPGGMNLPGMPGVV